MSYIYGLLDPRTKELRYIGKTTTTLRDRLNKHMTEARSKSKNYHKLFWIRALIEEQLRPEIIEIEEVLDIGVLDDRERYWIAYYRSMGANLVNLTEGGDGAKEVTKETRAKLSAASKGKPKTPEHRAKIGAARRGIKRPPLSEEWRTNISNGLKGEKNYWYGKHRSPETKLALSIANTGRFVGEKSPRFGVVVSAKTRKKLSIAARRTWAKKNGIEFMEPMDLQ